MNPCELAAAVTALAITISTKLNNEELAILSAVLAQLGDTLTTISVQRNNIDNC